MITSLTVTSEPTQLWVWDELDKRFMTSHHDGAEGVVYRRLGDFMRIFADQDVQFKGAEQ